MASLNGPTSSGYTSSHGSLGYTPTHAPGNESSPGDIGKRVKWCSQSSTCQEASSFLNRRRESFRGRKERIEDVARIHVSFQTLKLRAYRRIESFSQGHEYPTGTEALPGTNCPQGLS
jgi:hypothetical protein